MRSDLSATLEVLVIDDEPTIKKHVKDILKNAGFIISWCTNWKETKNLILKRFKLKIPLPDVILVDMYFDEKLCELSTNPAMEGILIIKEIITTFESQQKKCPSIIGFTRKLSYIEPEAIIKYGANDFITEAEYHRPHHFARRLIRSIMESQFDSSLKPLKKMFVKGIEEDIVFKALKFSQNDLDKAAKILRWPINEVSKVANRLEAKGRL
jgi:PleD family two-component response regulator